MLRFPFLFVLVSAVLVGNPEPEVIPIWPQGAPHALSGHDKAEYTFVNDRGITVIRDVVKPEIWVYHQDPDTMNGSSVLIFPGGGYWVLAIDHEGYQIADWLSVQGITPIIVKYRHPWGETMQDSHLGPLSDAQEAVRIVRRNAEAWNLDPEKIGVMGFSAGGHLAASVSNLYDYDPYALSDGISARPDFSVLVYPVISFTQPYGHLGSEKKLLGSEDAPLELQQQFSMELQVKATTPPTFLIHTRDDKVVPPENSISYFQHMLSAGVPGELHVFETGGHGFGLGNWEDCSYRWPTLCESWLRRFSSPN